MIVMEISDIISNMYNGNNIIINIFLIYIYLNINKNNINYF